MSYGGSSVIATFLAVGLLRDGFYVQARASAALSRAATCALLARSMLTGIPQITIATRRGALGDRAPRSARAAGRCACAASRAVRPVPSRPAAPALQPRASASHPSIGSPPACPNAIARRGLSARGAARPPRDRWRGRVSGTLCLCPTPEDLDQIEKASTCQRRSRGDARGAPGGGRYARRPHVHHPPSATAEHRRRRRPRRPKGAPPAGYRIAELYIERRGGRSIVGNIYKGKVDDVLPGLEAAFVDIGLEKDGFLHVDEMVLPGMEAPRRGRGGGRAEYLRAAQARPGDHHAGRKGSAEDQGRAPVDGADDRRPLHGLRPHGEGIGVSRRLEDRERERLRRQTANSSWAAAGRWCARRPRRRAQASNAG